VPGFLFSAPATLGGIAAILSKRASAQMPPLSQRYRPDPLLFPPSISSGDTKMRVAVASRNGHTVSGHIGKCADWILFEVEGGPDGTTLNITEVARVTLTKELVFHHFKDTGPHPLDGCAAVIGASAGDSFVAKMSRRGMEAVLTAEPDPATAVADFARHRVTPPKPRPIGSLVCKIRDALHSEE